MTLTITHPHIALLADPDTGVARVWNDVLAGQWGIAATVCASRLADPAATRALLDEVGASFAVADATPLTATLDGDRLTLHADTYPAAAALDLFMRVHCGQWNEMRYHCTHNLDTFRPDVDLTVLRHEASRGYDETVPHDDRGFPPHPNASISIAHAPLPAQIAYHAYKALGVGAPGQPTFALPDGPVTLTHEQQDHR